MLLLTGLLLSMAVYSPGYCLDPPVITPLDEFFIEHNGGDVQIAPPDWQLIVDGLVERPLALTVEEICEYPSQTHMATIECGGNPFAFKVANLIGNAVWTGVPVSTILDNAGLLDNAASVVFTSLDGYSNRISLNDIYQRDNIMLAYGMNGETLPPEQGYPLRLVFPGVAGSNWVQWVTHIEVTSEQTTGNFWPLPPHCQIFEPTHKQTIDLGSRRIYGMALAGDAEINAVEVSTDGGSSWQPATILTEYVPHTWRHWEFNWIPPAPGNYMLAARATDTSGDVQEEAGIYGWKMLSIELTAEGPDACVYGEPCAEGKYCDVSADQCVECLINGDCPSGSECVNGVCVSLIDTDSDGFIDVQDNCPAKCNPQQKDADHDGIGDVCDTAPGCGGCGQPACEVQGQCDSDKDGIADGTDNCPAKCNMQQKDADGDGIGDVCDTAPGCGGCGQTACEVVCTP